MRLEVFSYVEKKGTKEAGTNRISENNYPKLTFTQAIDLVVAAKKAEGLRERTLKDYAKMCRYFVNWINDNYEIETVDEVTTDLIRNYINWMKYDKKKYDGRKFITEDQVVGLSYTTININLRTIRAIFNQLEREELIEVNPVHRIKLIRQDVDLANALTDDEVKSILKSTRLRRF